MPDALVSSLKDGKNFQERIMARVSLFISLLLMISCEALARVQT